MKKMCLVITVLLLVSMAVAGENSKQNTRPVQIEAVTTATPKLGEGDAVITGTLLCLGCSLKKEEGANAQCSIYGHQTALKIETVVFFGSREPDKNYRGKIVFFLTNDRSAELLKAKYHGRKITIVGRMFLKANLVDVRFVKFTPKKKKGHGHH